MRQTISPSHNIIITATYIIRVYCAWVVFKCRAALYFKSQFMVLRSDKESLTTQCHTSQTCKQQLKTAIFLSNTKWFINVIFHECKKLKIIVLI